MRSKGTLVDDRESQRVEVKFEKGERGVGRVQRVQESAQELRGGA